MQNRITGSCVWSGSSSGREHEMAVPDRARESPAGPDRARQGQTGPEIARQGQTGPGRAEESQTGPERARQGQTRLGSTSQQGSSVHRTLSCFKEKGSWEQINAGHTSSTLTDLTFVSRILPFTSALLPFVQACHGYPWFCTAHLGCISCSFNKSLAWQLRSMKIYKWIPVLQVIILSHMTDNKCNHSCEEVFIFVSFLVLDCSGDPVHFLSIHHLSMFHITILGLHRICCA